ncbi:MAG: alanyl-tRNA editing protein [Pseudomonadota bacterium]
MTELLFRDDPYLREAEARVTGQGPDGAVVLNRTLFYVRGGGQPGDTGRLTWTGGEVLVTDTVKGEDGPLHKLDGPPPPEGTDVTLHLDWETRHRHMRMHTALHLLSVVVPLPVTGGQIGAQKSRLDFDMPEVTHDREGIAAEMACLIAADHPVGERWITEAELDANPGLVKTLSVQPPRGAGHIRLVRIGPEEAPVDLQPCGGTHVRSTAEIGAVAIGKIENKGKSNRRISITLEK